MTIEFIGKRRQINPIVSIHRSGQSSSKPNGQASSSLQKHSTDQNKQILEQDFPRATFDSTIEFNSSPYAQRAVNAYQTNADLAHRQHIQSILGIDEYA